MPYNLSVKPIIIRMPSKSRKKIKGQARKAKAREAAAATNAGVRVSIRQRNGMRQVSSTTNNTALCNHGVHIGTSNLCAQFISEFFQSYIRNTSDDSVTAHWAAKDALDAAYDKCPDAVTNENNLDVVKKNIISNGVEYILGSDGTNNVLRMSHGCATALMLIDSYDPFNPVPAGNFDQRDALEYLTSLDILNGCQRSLVKYFINRIPCNCLDGIYTQLRSSTSKMGVCFGCNEMKERNTHYICTGCERAIYCSKACQLADVPNHKVYCKCCRKHDHYG